MMEDKKSLRSRIRAEKKLHTAEELKVQSDNILMLLENHPKFQKAETVMMYASLPDEVQTLDFLEKWRHRKNIILPVVDGDDIIPTALCDGVEMQNGSFDILEPQNQAYTGNFDLIVIPGMAFDKACHRLGRGKGYYDRFLVNFPDVYKIGLCFDFQLLEDLPSEPHDQKIDEILTYNKI